MPDTRPGWVDQGMEGLTETDTMGALAQAWTGGVYGYSERPKERGWLIPGQPTSCSEQATFGRPRDYGSP